MIYLDLDCVLADFSQHIKNLNIPYNDQWHDPRETWTKETWAGEKIKTDAMHTPGFWLSIPVMPGAEKLWNYCEPHNPCILTAKPQPDSPDFIGPEKFEWVNKFLGPFDLSRFTCCTREQKRDYAYGNILVDDDPRNCKAWTEAGGIAILFTSAEQAISELENILNAAV